MWCEYAKVDGLSENSKWHENRVEDLQDQITAIQKVADERKFAVDVMAKQVIRGSSEMGEMRAEIQILENKVQHHLRIEDDLKGDVARFKDMLTNQLDVTVNQHHLEDKPPLSESIDAEETEKENNKAATQNDLELLNRLETETNYVVKKFNVQELNTTQQQHNNKQKHVYGEIIDPVVLKIVMSHPVQAVLCANHEGLYNCFTFFSNPVKTSSSSKRKRENVMFDPNNRVLDEHNFLRICR